jgi:hypothetical protein
MCKNMTRTSLFNLTSLDIDILRHPAEECPGRIRSSTYFMFRNNKSQKSVYLNSASQTLRELLFDVSLRVTEYCHYVYISRRYPAAALRSIPEYDSHFLFGAGTMKDTYSHNKAPA